MSDQDINPNSPMDTDESGGGGDDQETFLVGSLPQTPQPDLDLPEKRERKKRSDIWNHFQAGKSGYNQCKYCTKKYKVTSSMSTLRLHTEKRHAAKMHPEMPKKAKEIPIQFRAPHTLSEKEQKALDNQLTRGIISSGVAFRFVEDVEIRKWVEMLNLEYKFAHRNTIKSRIDGEYVAKRKKIRSYLTNLKNAVSVTFDLWSDSGLSFLAVTCHWVASWVLHKALLGFVQVTERHTGDYIADEVTKLLRDFGICEKVVSCTTDEGSNMVSAFRNISSEISKERTRKNKKFPVAPFRLRCIAHILHNVVECIHLRERDAVHKVRQIVLLLKKPTARAEYLKAAKTTGPGLSLDVPTRWNSTYYMLFNAKKSRMLLDEYLVSHGNKQVSEMMLADEDWKDVEDLIELLEPFEQITRDCSGSDFATVHNGCPSLEFLLIHLTEICQNKQGTFLEKAARDMKAKLEKAVDSWKHAFPAYAQILDPSFKTVRFDAETKKKILAGLKELTEFYGSSSSTVVDQSPEPSTSKVPAQSIRSRLAAKSVADAGSGTRRDELAEYLAQPLEIIGTDGTENFDAILGYWKRNERRFPALCAIARDIFCCQATSAQSERENSKAKNVKTDKRNKLSSFTVQATMCLKSWMKLPDEFFNTVIELD